MKIQCCILAGLIILFAAKTYSQNSVIGQSYKTTVSLPVQSYTGDSKQDSAKSTYQVIPGAKFTIVDITKDNKYIIQFGRFKMPDHPNKNLDVHSIESLTLSLSEIHNNNIQPVEISEANKQSLKFDDTTHAFIGYWSNYKRFQISAKDLDQKCTLYYTYKGDFTYGALTLPLKIRFGNGINRYSSYEENLNLGLTAGYKMRISGLKNQSFNLIGMVGVTSVNVDSLSLSDKTLYSSKNPTAKAITYGIGLVYQNDSFQIGILSGKDHISGLIGRAWSYQDRYWLGVGIGLALYNSNNTKTGSVDKQ